MNFIDDFKIKAIANNLGLEERTAKLFTHIHRITKKGKLDKSIFNKDIIKNHIINQRISYVFPFNLFLDRKYEWDLWNMSTQPSFRNESYSKYKKTILPRLHKYSFKDIFNYFLR